MPPHMHMPMGPYGAALDPQLQPWQNHDNSSYDSRDFDQILSTQGTASGPSYMPYPLSLRWMKWMGYTTVLYMCINC